MFFTTLFTIAILNLEITTTSVTFLTPHFMNSQIICIDEIKYDYSIEKATGHNYPLNITDKRCALTITGTNKILFPSIRHSFTIELDSSLIR